MCSLTTSPPRIAVATVHLIVRTVRPTGTACKGRSSGSVDRDRVWSWCRLRRRVSRPGWQQTTRSGPKAVLARFGNDPYIAYIQNRTINSLKLGNSGRRARSGGLMPLFHTTMFTNDPPGASFKSIGAAWSFEKRSGLHLGTPEQVHQRSSELLKERGHAPTFNSGFEGGTTFFDEEILIRSRSRSGAMQALNLLVSAAAVLDGSIEACPEPFSIELRQVGTPARTKSFIGRIGLLDACELANRVSRDPPMTYALHKLALSYQSSSPNLMDLHPGYSPRAFGVQNDPIYHVYLANAVTLAYSAIEELGLEIRASQKNPSKMPDGTWNPKVKVDLEARLHDSGIDVSGTCIWTLRGPKTQIEKDRRPQSAGKPSWSRGVVRDVYMQLINALSLASWLRSSTTTHRFTDTTRSLTAYDAHNVQSLARYLIMQKFGFWSAYTK